MDAYNFYMMPPAEQNGTILYKLKFAAKIVALLAVLCLIYIALLVPMIRQILWIYLQIGLLMFIGIVVLHRFSTSNRIERLQRPEQH
jgi:hypothetical protein